MEKKEKMIRNLFFSVCALALFSVPVILRASNYQAASTENDAAEKIPEVKRPADLVLIYDGFYNRPKYTPDEMRHYIFRNNGGKVEWLFDGFLFLEIYARTGDVEYDYGIASHGRISARKIEWENLLKTTFAEGLGPDAIEETIDSLVKSGVKLPYKREIVFSLPNPQVQCKDWGELNGSKMDFNKTEDRLEAVKWYVQQIRKIWKKKKYKYLNLSGFYWVHEQIDKQYGDDVLIKEVQAYLNKLGYPLIWIPYNGAPGVDENWKSLGFDIAYQQPNYFFGENTSIDLMHSAINTAEKYDMSLEMEFDDNVSKPLYRDKFYTYLREFEKSGAWDKFPVAYYEGGGAWLRMSQSSDPEMQKMVKAMGDILVKRKEKLSTIIK